jgi:S1-C subfamily serine protease
MYQISASISPGSSGGAVVNAKGELIGISTSTWKVKGSQNINFAIPINKVLETDLCSLTDTTRLRYNAMLARAFNAVKTGRLEYALALIDNYLDYRPADERGLQLMAQALVLKGLLNLDMNLIHKGIAIYKKQGFYVVLGEVAMRVGKINDAILAFQTAVFLDPTDAESYAKLAKGFGLRGNNEAEIHYNFIAAGKGSIEAQIWLEDNGYFILR